MPTAAYIGTAAHPIPLEWVDGVRVSTEGRYAIQSAPARRWAFVSAAGGAPSPRSWEVDMRIGNATKANLDALAMGAFGSGPFIWLPESAYITNALTPRQSLLLDEAGGAVAAVEGRAPRSALGPAVATLASGVPVMPGSPCTVSVDASGAASLQALFRNASGAVVANPTQAADGTLMQRIHLTVNSVPASARTVDILVGGHSVVTRPQVTWLRKPIPWAPGAGADSVVLDNFEATTMHLDARGDVIMSARITLQEVS